MPSSVTVHQLPQALHPLGQLATVSNDNLLAGAPAAAAEALNLLHNIHALCHIAKHHVLAVKPGGGYGAQEELQAGTDSSITQRADASAEGGVKQRRYQTFLLMDAQESWT